MTYMLCKLLCFSVYGCRQEIVNGCTLPDCKVSAASEMLAVVAPVVKLGMLHLKTQSVIQYLVSILVTVVFWVDFPHSLPPPTV